MTAEEASNSIKRRNLLKGSCCAVASTLVLNQPARADSHQVKTDKSASINWNVTHEEDTDNRFYSVCETTDPDEYIVAGWSANEGGFDEEPDRTVLLYRVTQSGSVVWRNKLDFEFPVRVTDVVHDGDDIFYAAGALLESDGETVDKGLAIKFDGHGDLKWSQAHSRENGGFTRLGQNDNGIYLAGGREFQENFSSNYVGWLVKMNRSGEFLWEKSYEETGPFRSISLSSTGIALTSPGPDNDKGSLIVTNTEGVTEFGKTYEDVYPKSVTWGENDNVHLCGETDLGETTGMNLFFLSLNPAGSQRYSNIVDPGSEATLGIDTLLETDTGFVTAGWFDDTEVLGANQKGWIVEYDQDGITSGYVAGGSDDDWINNILQLSEDQYLCVGSTTSFGESDDNNAWISSISTEANPEDQPGGSSDADTSGGTTEPGDSASGSVFSNILKISVGLAGFIFLLLTMAALGGSNGSDNDNSESISFDDRLGDAAEKDKFETDEYGQIKEE